MGGSANRGGEKNDRADSESGVKRSFRREREYQEGVNHQGFLPVADIKTGVAESVYNLVHSRIVSAIKNGRAGYNHAADTQLYLSTIFHIRINKI
jgi:hypothetical protein